MSLISRCGFGDLYYRCFKTILLSQGKVGYSLDKVLPKKCACFDCCDYSPLAKGGMQNGSGEVNHAQSLNVVVGQIDDSS